MAAATEYPTAVPPDGPADSALYNINNGLASPTSLGDNDSAPAPDQIGSPRLSQEKTSHEVPKAVQEVLESEIGIVTMLGRLKLSISSAKEFALFLKKRAQLEEDYSSGMRKLARMTQDNMARTEYGQDTFGAAFAEMMDIHARMADNGYQFSMSLHQMHEDLLELAAMAEKSRKGWKQTGLAAEQRVVDLETATRKSKLKYDSLAEEYDRARTGDVGGRRAGFGFKGPKSAAQHEEDLLRKLHAADEDYHGRVDTLSRERAELLATGRPEIIKALNDIVRECDGGLVLQVQKYASFSEKLLLSNGLSISPIKSAQKPDARSLREVVISVDSERDLNTYLTNYRSKVPPKSRDPKYERHPVLGGASGQPLMTSAAGGSVPTVRAQTSSQYMSQPTGLSQSAYGDSLQSPQGSQGPLSPMTNQYGTLAPAKGGPGGAGHERSFSYSSSMGASARLSQGNTAAPGPGANGSTIAPSGSPVAVQPPTLPSLQSLSLGPGGGAENNDGFAYTPSSAAGSRNYYNNNGGGSGSNSNGHNSDVPTSSSYTAPSSMQGPPQLGALAFQNKGGPVPPSMLPGAPMGSMQSPPQAPYPSAPANFGAVPGSKPVFGVSLETLYERDGLAVPMVVYQCIQAVDLFGLGVEGIYRLSGSLPHVNKLKNMFDTDTSSPHLDFRNPENFFHDVNSVAGLLKQFLRDLPDPLLPNEHYDRFIKAAQIDDPTTRRDELHGVINDLPDPNYATLRALILHLNRVVENAAITRMTSQNLAIVFGPTLIGGSTIDPEKGRWHVRVIDTILQNTYQIFDED